jgi:hypothetical protein
MAVTVDRHENLDAEYTGWEDENPVLPCDGSVDPTPISKPDTLHLRVLRREHITLPVLLPDGRAEKQAFSHIPRSGARALAYDVVRCGTELGSCSIRSSAARNPEHHLRGAGHISGRAAGALRLLPQSAAIRHASARRHCARSRRHRDDPRRRRQPARRDPLPKTAKAIDLMMHASTPVSDRR